MEHQSEKDLVLKIIEYARENEVFHLKDLYSDLGLVQEDRNFVYYSLFNMSHNPNPNHILQSLMTWEEEKPRGQGEREGVEHQRLVRLLPTALFSYIDHLEIIEARKAATDARRLSLRSMWISSILAAVAILLTVIQLFK
jgi:hypothetical protein